jgi:hypothetical protein
MFHSKQIPSFFLISFFIGVLTACVPQGPPPEVEEIIVSPGTEILTGGNASLIMNASGVDLTFEWTVTRGSLSSADAPSIIYTAPDTPGADTVTVKITTNGQTVVRSTTFNVVEPPTPTFTPSPSPTSTPTPSETPTPTETLTPTLTPLPPLTVADFDLCNKFNNLNGEMGGAYEDENTPELVETYPEETDRGCIAQLEYDLQNWAAFWLMLEGADLSQYKTLKYDIKADPSVGIPGGFKMEIKGMGKCVVTYVSDITRSWQTKSIELIKFERGDCGDLLESFEHVEELTFVFDLEKSGSRGIVFLDNIRFEP